MRVERVVPNLTVTDLPAAVAEHSAVLGLEVVMDHGWIVTLDDVHAAHAAAVAAGLEIVHPLREEEWGVTRFYRDSSGGVVNVGTHT